MPTSFPLTRRHALAAALALLAVLVVGGRLLASSDSGSQGDVLPVEPVAVAPETTERAALAEAVVHVVGAVRAPGLYRLEEGGRVADAIALAGGATPKADLAGVNLAAPLVDGTQVIVPRAGEPASSPASGSGGGAGGSSGPIRLNTATLEELQQIPGVGPVTAQRILDFREQNGGFRSVDELDAVPGIGPKRLEQLREVVTP